MAAGPTWAIRVDSSLRAALVAMKDLSAYRTRDCGQPAREERATRRLKRLKRKSDRATAHLHTKSGTRSCGTCFDSDLTSSYAASFTKSGIYWAMHSITMRLPCVKSKSPNNTSSYHIKASPLVRIFPPTFSPVTCWTSCAHTTHHLLLRSSTFSTCLVQPLSIVNLDRHASLSRLNQATWATAARTAPTTSLGSSPTLRLSSVQESILPCGLTREC